MTPERSDIATRRATGSGTSSDPDDRIMIRLVASRREAHEATQELESLRAQLDTAVASQTRATDESDDLRRLLHERSVAAADATERNRVLEAEQERLRTELAYLRRELSAVNNTRTMRYTAKLRQIYATLRG